MRAGSLVTVLVALAGPLVATAGERPNVVLVMADDQGWGDVGFRDHPVLQTPVLDAMARENLLLERFYAAAPVCSPTRGSVLTGRHPNRFGCFSWGYTLRPQEVTIAELLKPQGYATGHFGKWHLGALDPDSPVNPGHSGFDEWFSSPNFFENDPLMCHNGRVVRTRGEGSAVTVEAAVQFIRRAVAAQQPFLAVVWFGSPHAPHIALPEDLQEYAGLPERQQHFYGEITAMDRAIGVLRQELRRLRVADHTLFWYTSDNGALPVGSTGGLSGGKGNLFEGGLRVPAIIEWPERIRAARTSFVPCGTVDILPTVCEVAGAVYPDPARPRDGQSLVPLIDGTMSGRDKPLGFWVYPQPGIPVRSTELLAALERQQQGASLPATDRADAEQNESKQNQRKEQQQQQRKKNTKEVVVQPSRLAEGSLPGNAAWLDGDWKLHRKVTSAGAVTCTLYNLTQDVREQQDLAGDQPQRVAEMSAQLEAWQQSVVRSLNGEDDLWQVARARQDIHRFSTLFTAQNVRDLLATEAGIQDAIAWCRQTGVTKVYLESFRSAYDTPNELLITARDRFREAGFQVSGCVTTTIVGKRSTGWNLISCYTDQPTQEKLQEIFTRTARLFDEIMIDDFWFTDCECEACQQARRAQQVVVGDRTFPVAGEQWSDYRCELLVQASRYRILAAARGVNPNVKIIIKYPQWYDRFHERGYEVVRETADFDRIWVGTETRDYADPRWGGTPQYEAYFIMRWLGGIGGAKCGGGWFDPYGTTAATYVEQARQTVLAGARESLLFCYGSLLRETGPANVTALRQQIPELLEVAEQVGRRSLVGVATYKPPGSSPENEPRVFDFVGMLGVPLVPCHEFPVEARAAFFSLHALHDPDLVARLSALLDRGAAVLITDGLAARLQGRLDLDRTQVRIVPVRGEPKRLLELANESADELRNHVLQPLGQHFHAPAKVGLYLFADGSWVVENFRDDPVTVHLDGNELTVAGRGWKYWWKPLN